MCNFAVCFRENAAFIFNINAITKNYEQRNRLVKPFFWVHAYRL